MAVIGVIVGGRLGYVLFYEPTYFISQPLQIFALWQGGMSFHGGFLGVLIVLILWSRKHHVPFMALADIVVVPVAIGLALGRVGNFINQELYGTATTLPWGMYFPGAATIAESSLRHPTQLYAVGKDLLIAGICFWYLRLTKKNVRRHGCTAAAFLILYGVGRFLLEYLREQQYPLTDIAGIALTRGQLLTLPLLLLGFGMCILKRMNRL